MKTEIAWDDMDQTYTLNVHLNTRNEKLAEQRAGKLRKILKGTQSKKRAK